MYPFQAAKQIPIGQSVDDVPIRNVVLNLIVARLHTGTLGRGELVSQLSSLVGLTEDRPKKLVQWIKGGGGSEDQLALVAKKLQE
eukprot:m.91236 g.91236  ORF g.91236 m.91236 type:complete len:85 (-) comp13296_c0_seq5:135-389(-)